MIRQARSGSIGQHVDGKYLSALEIAERSERAVLLLGQ